ncbi:MAG: class II glutamine amidotransferase [Alphaproteobacteria bacterium]|nr:class II glutamine amidotransferase [Alphaproteobacteria bacterium]
MCRWLAYSGAPAYLDDYLFKPANSLIAQSLRARRGGQVVTNGDGFGVGWYGDRIEPGVYRDLRPAWNDENLRSLAEQIRTRLFFAHVRASTGTAVSRSNCHPFRLGNWLFMHNGQIGGFDRVARELDFMIAPELYRQRSGTTDSETLFLLMHTFGLAKDPVAAMRRTVAAVESCMRGHRIEAPLRLTCALTDGQRVIALRHSSDGAAPSLFFGSTAGPGEDSHLILSEPLDEDVSHWSAVEEGMLLTLAEGKVVIAAFEPG